MQNNNELKKLSKEIFHLSSIVLEFCKHNNTNESQCLSTAMELIYQKADTLNFKLMEIE